MWPWFHFGWLIIIPIAVMVFCILMGVFMRGHAFGGCAGCCGHGRSESKSQSDKKP